MLTQEEHDEAMRVARSQYTEAINAMQAELTAVREAAAADVAALNARLAEMTANAKALLADYSAMEGMLKAFGERRPDGAAKIFERLELAEIDGRMSALKARRAEIKDRK